MSINTAVQNASPKAIQRAFQRVINNHLPHDRWLGLRNRYRKDTIGNIDTDLPRSPNPPSLRDRQIAEYISVSTLTHCTDGWNYLARSIESILAGDEMSAIHLAYYAELRAVLSLMATQGIGIFNNKHIWFDDQQLWRRFSGPTHKTADGLINEWVKLEGSKSFLFNIIKVNSKSLNDWISATGCASLTPITDKLLKDWLSNWSIDLKLEDDQNIRNEASYRPKIFLKNNDCKDIIEKITTIWTACEPTTINGFQVLDSHLLRITLDEVFLKSSSTKTKNVFIADTIQSCGLTRSESLQSFLSRSHLPDDHLLITEAREDIRIDNSYDCIYNCLPIICRALLLLRLATGATEKFLDQSITRELTRFWWQNIGLNLGLWSNGNEPDDFKDLYKDIADAIEALDFSETTHWDSLKTASDVYAPELMKLKQFQRVGLWGIGI